MFKVWIDENPVTEMNSERLKNLMNGYDAYDGYINEAMSSVVGQKGHCYLFEPDDHEHWCAWERISQ
jgi:hypothetical protein